MLVPGGSMALPPLEGRTAVITGASRGIGAALAVELARRGLRLGLWARGAPVLPEGPNVVSARVDVTDEKALGDFVARVEDRFGAIDCWVNNAGVLEPIAKLREIEAEDFRRHIDVNLTGVFLGTRAYVRHLRARGGGGVLLNVSSGAAQNAYAGWSAYCAAKAAVDRLTECVQLEEASSGLRAHAIAPGVVDTAMQEVIRATPAERFPALPRFLDLAREDRFNTPAFVAERLLAIAFDPAARPEGVLVRLPWEKGEPA
jgi:NAD(P)-dependent dehydrogenase (short-subunit alcohol dehydrogenase family)